MSIESAKAFLERVRNDEDFRKSVGEIATVEQRIEYVKDAGFEFSKKEFNIVTFELSNSELVRLFAVGVWRGCSAYEMLELPFLESKEKVRRREQ